MSRILAGFLMCAALLLCETTPSLKAIHKLYIDKMAYDLDQYLRAEIMKQCKGRLTIVLDAKDADGILTGVTEEEKGTGAKVTGRYLGLHDVATGTVSLLDKDGKVLLWSDEAGDRSLFWGPLKRGGIAIVIVFRPAGLVRGAWERRAYSRY